MISHDNNTKTTKTKYTILNNAKLQQQSQSHSQSQHNITLKKILSYNDSTSPTTTTQKQNNTQH